VLETEVKILEIDRKKVEDTLVKMKAKKVFDGEIETFFYDFENGSVARGGDVLRLRRENNHAVLTYKKVTQHDEVKTAEEHSVAVSNLRDMQKILHSLCLSVTDSMKKHRTSYEVKGTRFDIEHYLEKHERIPEFLEIESDSIASIHKYARALGFKDKDCLPWSTFQLIEHYSPSKNK
jgi:predicted adenylyl cyclase CyaB